MSQPKSGKSSVQRRTPRLEALSVLLVAPLCVWGALVFTWRGFAENRSVIHPLLFGALSASSLAGLVLAIIATMRQRRRKPRLAARVMTVAGLAFGAAGFFSYLLLFYAGGIQENAVYLAQRKHLRQIGAAIFLYSDQNGGRFPPNLQTLVDRGLDPKVFIAPVRPWAAVPLDPKNVDATGDYEYHYYASPPDPTVFPKAPLVSYKENPVQTVVMTLFVDGDTT